MNYYSRMDIVDAIGTAELARRLQLRLNTVSNWRSRGVPYRWRPAVAKIARQKRIKIPSDFLLAPAAERPEAA